MYPCSTVVYIKNFIRNFMSILKKIPPRASRGSRVQLLFAPTRTFPPAFETGQHFPSAHRLRARGGQTLQLALPSFLGFVSKTFGTEDIGQMCC